MSCVLKRILRYSAKRTLQLCLLAELVCFLVCPQSVRLSVMGGILWGTAAGLAGFYMICTQVNALSPSVNGEKKRAYGSYMLRYLFYGVCLGIGAWLKISIIGMAAGILLQKISLILYAVQNRKDSE